MLRDLALKKEYNSGGDDIFHDFFAPCLSRCSTYDRCMDKLSLSTLLTLVSDFRNFAKGEVNMRLIVSHRLHVRDINTMTRLYSGNLAHSENTLPMRTVSRLLLNKKIVVRVAVSTYSEQSGRFSERMGIIGDREENRVAFTNASNEAFYVKRKSTKTIDVFTSWNDAERVDLKTKRFDRLWNGEFEHVKVHDYGHAYKYNILKYDSDWIVGQ